MKPTRLSIALCLWSGACAAHDSVGNAVRGTSVEQGRAVEPWNDAQLVVRPEDADSDASVGDAAMSDAAVDAGSDSAAPEDETFGIDARCIFRVTTLSLGGRYAPKNIAAIWIERMEGTWVKTLAVWAGVRLRYLTAYRRANPTGNKVDAVTSATLPAFGARAVGWNLADAAGEEVREGDYVVKVEITDRDATGQTLAFPFRKPRPPFAISLPDTEYFSGAQLRCR
ncbi:MAG TPA: DUF2271 domain-containing protein [Polyangiales bacterium]|nr:DUF2271 domain-containing protein [Polyangiales bacterium]